MAAAATKSKKTTATPKRKGTAAAALAKPIADLTAAEKKKVIAEANKNPRALTPEQRAELAALGLAAAGLRGKARKLWIEQGETPAETVKRNPGKAPAGKGKAAGGKAPGKLRGINAVLVEALAAAPKKTATIEQLVEAVSKGRGATTRGTVRSYLKGGVDKGWWKLDGEKVTGTAALGKLLA